MRKISEVLRLEAAGLSVRQIATSTGSARATVHDYLVRSHAGGLAWPLPADLDDQALEALLFPALTPEMASRRPVPDWDEVRRELRRPHVTRRLLWLEWKKDHPQGWSYTQYCEHYREWLGTKDVVMRLNFGPGERMFVDYAGDTVAVGDPATGEARPAQVFVATLGCSGLLYAEATWSQELGNWLSSHVRAYEYYGGAPVATTPDYVARNIIGLCTRARYVATRQGRP